MQRTADVIVLGLSPTGLYAVREAARAGYSVLGVGAPAACGLWSRFLTERIVADTPNDRVDAILNRVRTDQNEKPVLIVTSDQDLEAVISRSEALSRVVHLQGAYTNGLASRIMDKDVFYQLCERHGVVYPSLWSAAVDLAEQYREQIAYPSMIKPARIQDVKHLMAGQKGWIVKDAAEFDATLPKIPFEAGTLLMQEIVPGPESNITLWCGYLDANGQVRQRFTARKLRQYPAGFGSASLVQSETCAETAEIAEGLLSAMGYRGIAAAEFKRHPETGKLKIIEVNPRPSLWFSLATKAGVPLIETAVAEAIGKPVPAFKKQVDGMLWRYATKDLASRVFYLRNRNFVLPEPDLTRMAQVTGHADVSGAWDDPAPAAGEVFGFARKLVKRLRSKGCGRV
jgi:predicted ATP-grasp superfamily ATP-dependent carboligase